PLEQLHDRSSNCTTTRADGRRARALGQIRSSSGRAVAANTIPRDRRRATAPQEATAVGRRRETPRRKPPQGGHRSGGGEKNRPGRRRARPIPVVSVQN